MAPKAMVDHLLYLLIWVLIVMNTQVHCECDGDKVDPTVVESAVAKGAVCLDGQAPAYHHGKGFGDGANNWMVFLSGGGWCTNETECLEWKSRSYNPQKAANFSGIFGPNKTLNPDFYNWNRVLVKYCDGSSFIGDVDVVDPETKQYRRGARVFDAIMEDLLTKGLANASNVMLVGSSAGGLATVLQCDRFRALVPNASRVKCVAGSSFFIRAKDLPGAEERESYYSRLVEFHNISKLLPTSCTSTMDPGLCFFPENLVGHIQTPLFILNSAFDQYQIQKKLIPHPGDEPLWENCTKDLELCTPGQLQSIREFGVAFMKTLDNVGNCSKRGMLINSCYTHDFLFNGEMLNGNGAPKLENKTMLQAISDWYFDRCFVQEIDPKIEYPTNCFA